MKRTTEWLASAQSAMRVRQGKEFANYCRRVEAESLGYKDTNKMALDINIVDGVPVFEKKEPVEQVASAKVDPREAAIEAKLTQVRSSSLWYQLMPAMQVFLEEFIMTGNRLLAARTAFSCKNEKAEKNAATKALNDYRVQRLLAEINIQDSSLVEREEILHLISDRLRDPDTAAGEFVRLLDTYQKLKGGWKGKDGKVDEEAGITNLDDAVRAEEAKRKAANGSSQGSKDQS
jgi:hypothetical protein